MFRFALKCLHFDKNGKNIYENEMFKLLNILWLILHIFSPNYLSVHHFKK